MTQQNCSYNLASNCVNDRNINNDSKLNSCSGFCLIKLFIELSVIRRGLQIKLCQPCFPAKLLKGIKN